MAARLHGLPHHKLFLCWPNHADKARAFVESSIERDKLGPASEAWRKNVKQDRKLVEATMWEGRFILGL
jgi:hypothetical protein